jgi:plasmid stabilization system protein ParE
MSLPVVTRPAAASEIETAYRWYEKEREGLGSEFLEAVDKLVKAIAESPERFPSIRKDIRRAVLRRFPYSIFYRIASGQSGRYKRRFLPFGIRSLCLRVRVRILI